MPLGQMELFVHLSRNYLLGRKLLMLNSAKVGEVAVPGRGTATLLTLPPPVLRDAVR